MMLERKNNIIQYILSKLPGRHKSAVLLTAGNMGLESKKKCQGGGINLKLLCIW